METSKTNSFILILNGWLMTLSMIPSGVINSSPGVVLILMGDTSLLEIINLDITPSLTCMHDIVLVSIIIGINKVI